LPTKNPITGIILSGGKSARMGQDKAFLNVDGVPMIQRILALFTQLFRESLIITNDPAPYLDLETKTFKDLFPNHGALGGLYTGLFFSSFHYSFCVACDMPFLKETLIEYLLGRIDSYNAIVPRTADGLQPLHALYSKDCLEPIARTVREGKSKIIDFYPLVKIRVVEENEFLFLDPLKESFTNINTVEELDQIRGKRNHR
jgi:molybdopterin-guanine dinucleotide biosynthesis protein A